MTSLPRTYPWTGHAGDNENSMTKPPIKRARHKYRIWKREYSPTREHPTDEFHLDINTAIITASKKSSQAIDAGVPCMYFPRLGKMSL